MVFLISTLLGKNGAVKGGGLILSKNVDLEILGGVHCSANTAQERGGAMSVGEGSSISGTGAVFLENEAGTGGAIYIEVQSCLRKAHLEELSVVHVATMNVKHSTKNIDVPWD